MLFTLLSLATTSGLATGAAPQINEQPLRGPAIIHEPDQPATLAPMPLVLLLHGMGDTQSDTMSDFGLTDAVSQLEGFVLCVPTGWKVPPVFPPLPALAGLPFWNASPACCDVAQLNVDDVTYLTDLVDTLVAGGNVDPRRVYAVGFSNGGFMTYRLLREHPERFAGVATVAGSIEVMATPPTEASHVLHVHGELDNRVQLIGGTVFGGLIAHLVDHVSVWELIDFWLAPAGMNYTFTVPPPLELTTSGTGNPDTTVERYDYTAPALGSLEFWRVGPLMHSVPQGTAFSGLLLDWLFERRQDGEGTPDCIAAPMTTCASDAELGAFMFNDPAGPDQLRLVAEGIPNTPLVHFSYSLTPVSPAPPTNGPCLCLTGTVNRIASVHADDYARASADFPKADLDALIGAGSTVHFQTAHMNSAGVFEFSNVLVVSD
ncbi:MAG: prolyl oligopeptidase family serine peptidase [Planctomycetota bacterium]